MEEGEGEMGEKEKGNERKRRNRVPLETPARTRMESGRPANIALRQSTDPQPSVASGATRGRHARSNRR